MAIVTADLHYRRIWLTEFFHDFPHLDFSFSDISAAFRPDNEKYRESLWMWAAVPMLVCIIFWLLYLLLLCLRCCCCCYCCCRKPAARRRPKRSRRCCPLSAVLLLLGCGALAVTMYGNTKTHRGVGGCVHALRTAKKTIGNSQQIMTTVTRLSEKVERRLVPDLIRVVKGTGNSSAVRVLLPVIQEIGQDVNSSLDSVFCISNSSLPHLLPAALPEDVNTVEYVRWVLVIVVCCLYIILFIAIFAGLLRKSRKKLIVATVVTVVLLPAVWGLASVHLAVAVGSGDLCVDPNTFLRTQLNNTVDEDLLSAYMECTDKSQPFGKEMLQAQTAVSQAMTALSTAVNMSSAFNISSQMEGPVQAIQDDLQSMSGNLSSLHTLVGSCRTLHNQYTLALQGLCRTALYGVGYVLLSALLTSLCSSFLVCCCAVAWSSFQKQPGGGQYGYEPVDDTDPFVPAVRSPQRSYGSLLSGPSSSCQTPCMYDAVSINDGDGQLYGPDLLGDSPPTLHYSSILEEYTDLAPTPSSIHRSS